MATLTLTIAAGANAGSSFRHLAKIIERASMDMPDVVSTGASTVMTIDNGAGPVATVQITAGPYTGNLFSTG